MWEFKMLLMGNCLIIYPRRKMMEKVKIILSINMFATNNIEVLPDNFSFNCSGSEYNYFLFIEISVIELSWWDKLNDCNDFSAPITRSASQEENNNNKYKWNLLMPRDYHPTGRLIPRTITESRDMKSD